MTPNDVKLKITRIIVANADYFYALGDNTIFLRKPNTIQYNTKITITQCDTTLFKEAYTVKIEDNNSGSYHNIIVSVITFSDGTEKLIMVNDNLPFIPNQ